MSGAERAAQSKICKHCCKPFFRNIKYSDAQWSTSVACSRRCGAWNLGLTSADDPRIAKLAAGVAISARGRPGWSKGLTKLTHPSLAVVSRKNSVNQRGKKINDRQLAALKLGHGWSKGLTAADTPSIRVGSKKVGERLRGRKNPEHSAFLKKHFEENPDQHINARLARRGKGAMTYIEKVTSDLLIELGVSAKFNYRIGSKWADFAVVDAKLIVEADGEYWHGDRQKEAERDAYLAERGWIVLHVKGALLARRRNEARAIIEEFLLSHGQVFGSGGAVRCRNEEGNRQAS